MTVSPLAPAGGFPDMPVIKGAEFASISAGVRYEGRDDVMLATLQPGSTIAGVFTRSSTRAASVLDCQRKIGKSAQSGAAILVNSGNANAFTGAAGDHSVAEICAEVSRIAGVPADRVFTSSTGVIGEKLPHRRIVSKLEALCAAKSPSLMQNAARAIMTTDTFAKGATRTITIDGAPVQIAGFAKGSGMIAPDMATMLVYVFTDAIYEQGALQRLVSQLNETTFNSITVDSDTSTSDMLLCAATGAAGVEATDNADFARALGSVMRDLAHQVVCDGEGASKFVEVSVAGAVSDSDAKKVAMSIANSPLVKTAIAGQDPNWGRIVMAVGKSGATADRDRLSIRLGDILVAENGWISDTYTEAAGAAYMQQQKLAINVDLGLGEGSATVWTCDLTHGYIDINADYRS